MFLKRFLSFVSKRADQLNIFHLFSWVLFSPFFYFHFITEQNKSLYFLCLQISGVNVWFIFMKLIEEIKN